MELEHHQLDLRYEALRVRRPERERQLLASLADHGQQAPIVVVAGDPAGRYVVVDGFKRVRALSRLGRDTVMVTVWDMAEVDALLLSRALRSAEAESVLEQGWLLTRLSSSFGMSQEDLARRFDRSPSWVSRRLALVTELPAGVQEEVRRGRIGGHAAMKHLVPVARASAADCERLARAIAPLKLSTREVSELHRAWRDGGSQVRQRVVSEPELFLKASREIACDEPGPTAASVIQDLDLVGVLLRRVRRVYPQCQAELEADGRESVKRCLDQAQCDLDRLKRRVDSEGRDADTRATHGGPRAVVQGSGQAGDCECAEDLEEQRPEGDPIGIEDAAGGQARGQGRGIPQRDPLPVRELQGKPAAGP
jgi:ParB family chromosome partitioning protein